MRETREFNENGQPGCERTDGVRGVLRRAGRPKGQIEVATECGMLGDMSADAQRILDEALKLPDQDRAALALRLLDSVGEPASEIEHAWIEEAKARLADIERGSVQTAPWAQARERIFAIAFHTR